jgi:Tfp pilus assembly protein PilZ
VTAQGSGDQAALVSALSEHGMFVAVHNPLLNGTTAEFTLHLPKCGPHGIRVQGKVIYRQASPCPGKTPGMGVKFLKAKPEDSALIKAFIEEKLLKGIEKTGTHSGNKKNSIDPFYQCEVQVE